jgi:hypothetical protein
MNQYVGVSAPKFLLTGTTIRHDSYIIAVVRILAYNSNSCTCICVVLFSAAVQQIAKNSLNFNHVKLKVQSDMQRFETIEFFKLGVAQCHTIYGYLSLSLSAF